MKKLYLMMLLNVPFMSINAQSFAWAKKGGASAYDYGYGIANDNSGNVYVAGKFEKNANFNGTILPCQGNHDIYVAQYSPSGNLNWIRTGGGSSGDYAHALVVEGSYVYIAGEIQGSNETIKFPGSSITLKAVGDNDVFLAKYTLSGTLLWARSAGSTTSEKALGIAVDKLGNVFICGYYTGYTKFGSVSLSNSGNNDVFIAKYDGNGNFLWVQKAGGAGRDEAKSIKCDASGNVYICGMYSNGCKFGSQTLSSLNSHFDMFLAKYSTGGSLLWVKTGGGKYDDVAWSLAIDKVDNLYVGGEFNSSANFGGTSISTTGAADIFVARYDVNGNVKWIRKAGSTIPDRARGIACAGSNVYITGQFGGSAHFGPYTKTAVDSSDIFTACLDNAGNFKWVMAAGGSKDAYEDLGYESGNAICAETSGNVYTTGAMLNGATFGSTALTAFSRTDMFLVKITSPATREADESVADNNESENTATAEIPEALNPDIRDNITDMKVYPNPSDENFVMELTSKENVEYQLVIFNSIGQVVEHRQITAPTVSSIDMSNKEKGIYIIEVSNADEMHRQKVILK